MHHTMHSLLSQNRSHEQGMLMAWPTWMPKYAPRHATFTPIHHHCFALLHFFLVKYHVFFLERWPAQHLLDLLHLPSCQLVCQLPPSFNVFQLQSHSKGIPSPQQPPHLRGIIFTSTSFNVVAQWIKVDTLNILSGHSSVIRVF